MKTTVQQTPSRPKTVSLFNTQVDYPAGYCVTPPSTVQIEVTGRCNLRCYMCPRETLGWKDRNIPDMSPEMFEGMIQKLPDEGVNLIILTGMGETLLHKHIVNFVRMAQKKAPVRITTNGTLLKEPMIRKLLGAQLSELVLSLDSPSKKEFEIMRAGANFDKIIQNLANLLTIKDELSSSTKMIIAMVITEHTFDKIQEMISLCSELDVSLLQLLANSDPGAKKIAEYVPDYQKRLARIDACAKENGVEIAWGGGDIGGPKEGEPALCRRPFTGIYVNCDGRVSPCCIHEWSEKEWLSDFTKETFDDVWNGIKIHQFRDALCSDKKPEMCANCSHLYR